MEQRIKELTFEELRKKNRRYSEDNREEWQEELEKIILSAAKAMDFAKSKEEYLFYLSQRAWAQRYRGYQEKECSEKQEMYYEAAKRDWDRIREVASTEDRSVEMSAHRGLWSLMEERAFRLLL